MITFITGPMLSGKTTELLRYLERAIRGKKNVCLLRPITDTRDRISHSKATEFVFNDLEIDIFYIEIDMFYKENDSQTNKLIYKLKENYDTIGIDECQFVTNLSYIIQKLNSKDIYISGLLATSECVMFKPIIDVLPYCENIIKLNSVCSVCGNDYGNYTFYKAGSKVSEVVIGGAAEYDARCFMCYNKGLS